MALHLIDSTSDLLLCYDGALRLTTGLDKIDYLVDLVQHAHKIYDTDWSYKHSLAREDYRGKSKATNGHKDTWIGRAT